MTTLQQSAQQWKPLIDAAANGSMLQWISTESENAWRDFGLCQPISEVVSRFRYDRVRIKPEPRDRFIVVVEGREYAFDSRDRATSFGSGSSVAHFREVL